jgi:predicted metalloprotease with PDZ domain
MRALWKRYGVPGIGVPEDAVESLADEFTGTRLRSFFDRALRSTAELPLKQMLATVGLAMNLRPPESLADKGGKPASNGPGTPSMRVTLGVRMAEDPAGVKLTHVLDAGCAQAAGLSAGDVIVAVDGLKVTSKTLEKRLAHLEAGDRVRLHFFRRDELTEREITLRGPAPDTCFVCVTSADAAARRRRAAWLGN